MLEEQAPVVTDRLARRVEEQFAASEAATVVAVLDGLRLPLLQDSPEATERVQAAIAQLAAGNSMECLDWAAQAEVDWRDVLVAAGWAGADWAERLDAFFV